MALWDDLKSEVFVLTNRPELVSETEFALKNAIRTAHRAGKFWRDLITTTVVPADSQIQNINLNDVAPRFRQLKYLRNAETLFEYREVDVSDLLDNDGFRRSDVFWAMGNTLTVRLGSGLNQFELAYYRQPLVSPPESIEDWLLTDYRDVVTLLAAATVLGMVGEQEIKSRIDALTALAIADLISDNIEVTGR